MVSRTHLTALVLLWAFGSGVAADPVTVKITDEVIRNEVVRLGINTGGDNYWDGAITRIRAADNFEGVMYRMISWGPELREDGLAVWFSPPKSAWEAMEGKVKFTLLGPPNKGVSGTIEEITTTRIRDGRTITFLKFDRKVKPSKGHKNGILLEYEDFDQGSIRQSSNKAFWNTPGNAAHVGDVPPGSFGKASLWLRPAKGEDHAHYAYVPMWPSQAPQSGTWRVQLWAKRKAGAPKFSVSSGIGPTAMVDLTDDWKKYDLKLQVQTDDPKQHVVIRLNADGGQVLVDDVLIWKQEDHRNPTPFRDPFVDVIQRLRPGTLRILQMGGSDLANNLKPPLSQMKWSRNFGDLVAGSRNGARYYKFNLHDYYALCKYVGADPWYCLPGTIHPSEMKLLMEYLGGPAQTQGGKLRVSQGQDKPWTQVFDKIYIEFGNEAWNPGGYATGSFNGPDHWNDLIAAGRESPHCRPNIVWVAGSQAGSPGVTAGVLRDVPNADSYAIAPYMMNQTRKSQISHFKTDADLFRWAFGYAIRRVVEPTGKVYAHHELTSAAGKDLSIYEHNFHLTLPKPEKGGVSYEKRNELQTSLGAGLAVINDALLMLREHGIQPQCQFNLSQRSYYETRLWGFVPGIDIGDQRYRPHYLCDQLANEVMSGSMLATRHGPGEPTFSARGYFEDDRRKKQTYQDIPTLWSYAFSDGKRRALILFNLDVQESHEVKLALDGPAAGAAVLKRVEGPSISADNEPEHAPQVKIVEQNVPGFGSGTVLGLPAHSMTVLQWTRK
jgi:hypothetical protein